MSQSLAVSVSLFLRWVVVCVCVLFPGSVVCVNEDLAYDLSFVVNPNNTVTAPAFATLPKTISYKLAAYGGNVISATGDSSVTVPVVVASPSHGCSRLVNPLNSSWSALSYYAGKVVVVDRSSSVRSCATALRTGNVIAVQGLAAIVVERSTERRNALSGSNAVNATLHQLPTLVIDFADGQHLITALLAEPDIPLPITIPSTGPATLAESQALRQIISNWTWKNTPNYDGTSHGTLDWPQFLSNPSADPCLQRLVGTVCVGGHVVQMELNDLGLHGGFAQQWQAFTHLNILNLKENPGLTGGIPCGWGSMSSLQYVNLEGCSAQSMSSCLGAWTSVAYFNANNNNLTNLPAELSAWTSIVSFTASNNRISTPMMDLTNWLNTIQYLDVSYNLINGAIPSIAGSQSISQMNLNSNRFTSVDVTAFDQTALFILNISDNLITGPLPLFNGSLAMDTFFFDHNQFWGSIPLTWTWLIGNILVGSHNNLNGSLEGLANLGTPTYIDLSFNQLTTPSTYATLSQYLVASLPNNYDNKTIVKLFLQNNQLTGSLADGIPIPNLHLDTINLSNNNITVLPRDVFHINPLVQADTLEGIDLSMNPLMTGSLPATGPATLLQYIYLHGCPLLRDMSSPPQLPGYITTASIFTKNSREQRYDCPLLVAKPLPFTFTVDPSYYSYQGCICGQGSFGGPPLCATIPTSVSVVASASSASDVSGSLGSGSVSDGSFGNDRMSVGIDVAFLLGNQINMSTPGNASSSNPSSKLLIAGDTLSTVRTIYITFRINQDVFVNFTDLVEVYMGGVDLKGKRVTAFRGEDPLIQLGVGQLVGMDPNTTARLAAPASSAAASSSSYPVGTIVVFNSLATISFRSRAQGGQHFVANFSLSSECPAGYIASGIQDNQHESCIPLIPTYHVNSGIQDVIYVFAAFVTVLLVIVLGCVIKFRTYVVFRAASVPFCVCILIFGIILSASSIFYAITPEQAQGSWICHFRPWFTCISLTGLFACLYVKVDRIAKIFNNNKLPGKNEYVDDKTLFKMIGWVMMAQIAILIGLSAADLSHRQLIMGSGITDGYQLYTCTSTETQSYVVWLCVQCAFVLYLMVSCVVTAFRIRNVPSDFNESSHLGNCIYVFGLICVLVLPINFAVDSSPGALILIRGMAQPLAAFSMVTSLFANKLYLIAIGKGNKQVDLGFGTQGKAGGSASRNSNRSAESGGGAGNGTGTGNTSAANSPVTSPRAPIKQQSTRSALAVEMDALYESDQPTSSHVV